MPREVAKNIYYRRYVQQPGFASVLPLSERIAEELVDTGVNMGPSIPQLWLQQCLNALNQRARKYADIKEDGDIGAKTLAALRSFLKSRPNAESIMLKALNALQGARYIELARGREANEDFLNGWLANRVGL